MSILGRLLRSLFASPDPARESDKLDAGWAQLAAQEQQIRVAREVRELLADARYAAPRRLERHGRKVWSQCDEDGILEEIFRRIGVASHTFVEFGASNGRECNTLKLLVEGWRGLWMESDPGHCESIRRIFADRLADGRLELQQTSVSADNIDGLLTASRIASAGDLDLLCIDIDGNDYHILKAIRSVRPRVLVIEYNGKFPPPMDLVQPYDPARTWDGSDYSGSSLQALANLAGRRGYRLVGTNITGVNAFFVRSDLAGEHFADGGTAELYNPARYFLISGFVAGHPPGDCFSYTSDAALEGKLTNT